MWNDHLTCWYSLFPLPSIATETIEFSLPALNHSVVCSFVVFGIIWVRSGILENRVPLQPVLKQSV